MSAIPTEVIFDLVARYGYVLVFVLGILEALPLVGIVAPGHATILLAGVAAAGGLLQLGPLIALAVVAGVIGDAIGFWIARRYGAQFLDRYGARLRITPRAVARSNAVFERYGPFALVVVRFSFVARSVGPLLAGVSKMPWRTFWIYNVLGAVIWGVGNVLGGYFFGLSFLAVQGLVGRILAYTLLAVLGVVLLYRTLRRFAPGFTRVDFAIAVLAIGAGALFGVVADLAADHGLDNALDRGTDAATRFFAPVAPAFRVVDLATHFAVLGTFALVLFAVLLNQRRKWEATLVALGMGGILVLVGILQPVFGALPQSAAGAEFPSPHAAVPLVLVGTITYLVAERTRRPGPPVLAASLGLLVVATASLSRMAQGDEYPTAVVAGTALGAAWFGVSLLLVEFGMKRRSPVS